MILHTARSFDIDSLFIIVSLEETNKICVDNFFYNKTKVNILSKESLKSALELATLDFSTLDFNLSFRRTILAEDLKTIFNFEEQWMFDFPIDRGAISNKKNYDDAFLLSSPQP